MFKKNKKTFNTKKIINWKRFDILAFVFILGINLITFIDGDKVQAFKGLDNHQSITVYLLFGIFILIAIFVNSLPYIAIYFALKYAIKKHIVNSATFNANNDIDYYRDIFKGISPATMSLIMDLGLEPRKDIGAMRLYYEMNDVIRYDQNGKMYVNPSSELTLTKSDEILLSYLVKNNNDVFVLNEWKESVICENVNNGLVRRKNKQENKKSGCGLFLFIHILTLCIMIFFGVCIVQSDLNELDQIIKSAPEENVAFLNHLSQSEESTKVVLMLFGSMVCFFIHGWSLISGFIYLIASSSVKFKDKIRRTDEGDYLAEKLYGMKNFIRDFSNLDEASKKNLVLWREFLIYAVVLEENDIILKEISNSYNIDLSLYKREK